MSVKEGKATLRCTKDYDIFEPHPYNRDISRTKILEESMTKYGFDCGLPVRCVRNGNGKLKITHGHHRFHVARELGMPVWFIVANNDLPLFESEASGHQWSVRDYTVARARAGEKPALEVLKYHQETNIPLNSCISMLGGEGACSGNMARSMKLGKFVTANSDHARMVGEIVTHCRNNGVGFASNSYFVKALSKCMFVKEFDVELFMHKVAVHSDVMEERRGVDDYLDLIELVYNRQTKRKLPIAFLARETSKQRSATFGKCSRKQ